VSIGERRPAEKGFVRNFLGVSAGNYGAIGLSFALNVVLTWRLGAEQFGRLALLIMAVQVLASVIFNWTHTGLIRFGAQEFAKSGSVAESFWSRMVVISPWLLAATLGLAAVQDWASAYFGVSVAGIWLVFGYFFLSSLLLSFGGVFQACQQMDRYAVTLFLDKAGALVGVLLLPASYAQDPVAVVGCYAASSLLVSAWAIAKLGRLLAPAHASRAAIGSMWTFSIPLIVSTWVGLIGTQWINYAIIKYYLSFSDLGLYSLASQVAGVAQQVTIISSSLLLPHFAVLVSRRQQEEIRRQVERVVPYGLLGFALLLSVGVLAAKVGLPLVFGPSFTGAVQPLILLLVASMGLALFNTFMPLISAYGETWVLTGITLASALVNLAGTLLLVPSYGINGAALATVLTYGSAAAFMLAVVQRRLGLPILRFAALGLPVVVVALCGALLDDLLGFYLAGLAGLVVSTYVLVVTFGLFGRGDMAELARMDMPVLVKSGLTKVFSAKAG